MVQVRFCIISFVPSTVVLKIPSTLIVGVGNVGGSISMLFGAVSVSVWFGWPACESGLNIWLNPNNSVEPETVGESVGVWFVCGCTLR